MGNAFMRRSDALDHAQNALRPELHNGSCAVDLPNRWRCEFFTGGGHSMVHFGSEDQHVSAFGLPNR
jgi:hypothetical protein